MPDQDAGSRGRAQGLVAEVRSDPATSTRRTWAEALRLGAALGLPIGVVPAALLLELAPQLGLLWPALASFGGSIVVFSALARLRHRAVPWVVAGTVSLLLIVTAVLATAWTLTQSITHALA